jgi:hypothetical protein
MARPSKSSTCSAVTNPDFSMSTIGQRKSPTIAFTVGRTPRGGELVAYLSKQDLGQGPGPQSEPTLAPTARTTVRSPYWSPYGSRFLRLIRLLVGVLNSAETHGTARRESGMRCDTPTESNPTRADRARPWSRQGATR